MSREPIMTFRNLAKRFPASKGSSRGSVLAITGVTSEIHEGEIVCIVGSSGCGKSTLLNMVCGLERPTTGRIELDGQPVTGPGPDRGMVFQSDCLFPWLSVRKNARFALRLRANAGTAESFEMAMERAEHLIDEVGLGAFKDAYPKELSGGMRQRAAIARALVNRPRMLLMDEPFGALDAQTREDMQQLLLALAAEQKTTVLFVTHDVEEAVYLADRVLVLKPHPGELIADVRVDLPRPRRPERKLQPEFSEYRRHVLALIQQREVAVA